VLVLTFALTVIFDLVKAIAVGLVVHYAIVLIRKLIEKKKANANEATEEIAPESVEKSAE
jgi:MFS superfamily sulfate permease-like transporter